MVKQMAQYFTAEKQESLLFVAVGLLAIAIAIWLWMSGHRLKSMAFPLIAIALIQTVVGATVYLRTDGQLAQLTQQIASAADATHQSELARMETVMKNFTVYKFIEIVLLGLGVGLIAFLQRQDWAAGIGAGLVLQSAFMLTLDIFAEARGQDYVKALGALTG
jgi:hypothetical protein